MRFLDRCIGRPLCFVASAGVLASRWFGSERNPTAAPRAILFIMLAEIGALVLTQPALRRARERFPGARLLFLTFPSGVEMLSLMGFAREQIFVIDPGTLATLLRSTLHVLGRLRREAELFSVNFEVYSRFSTLVAYLSGARKRAGFFGFFEEGGYQGNLVTQRVVYSPHHHMAASYVGLVEALDASPGCEPCAKVPAYDVAEARLRVPIDESLQRAVLDKIRRKLAPTAGVIPENAKLIILNGNSSDLVPLRRWPEDQYAELARKLLENPRHVVVLTGSGEEASHVAAMAKRIDHDRLVDLAGLTTLAELIALCGSASLMVTNDSGPAHFASTTDVPTLVLFGPETPRIFGPLGPNQEVVYLDLLCSPCVNVYNQKHSSCSENRCMREIPVNMVFEHCRRLLDRNPKCDES
ncbi:MAG: glycosyltransferase family 9 protein [Rhodospirillales bacterium]|nr:glycosyltransferase family 9 protein [Rhodospirillales bacterium]